MRWQVFLGAFIGYAGFYLVRKNLSMAIPEMEPLGFAKAELGFVLGLNAAGYAFSKFLMGSVSDRSNARVFLPLGLVLSAVAMCFMIVPIKFIGAEHCPRSNREDCTRRGLRLPESRPPLAARRRGTSLFPLPSSLFPIFNTEALKSQRNTEDFSFSAPSLCESLFLCVSVLKTSRIGIGNIFSSLKTSKIF